jgi:hypothetical protein
VTAVATNWKYQVLPIGDDELEVLLNKEGSKGWEAVMSIDGDSKIVFKMPKKKVETDIRKADRFGR